MGLAKILLVPEYKKHLNKFGRGSGNAAENLLNRGRVQTLFKGNITKLEGIQKVLDAAGVEVDGAVNDLDLIKHFAHIMQQKGAENKLSSFLLSLKSALDDIDGDNKGGM